MTEKPLFKRIMLIVLQTYPGSRCFSCIADELGVAEPQVRSAAQLLAVRGSFKIVRRRCGACSHLDDTFAPEKTITHV
jgi:hypothetical protein